MRSYNTRQRAAIVSFFLSNQERSCTPEDIAAALPDVPQSTVYRIISQLSFDGTIRRSGTDGRKNLYQYQGKECPGHMHIRCRNCGRIEHLDPQTTRSIESLVENASGFMALDTTVFEGLCSECRGQEKP